MATIETQLKEMTAIDLGRFAGMKSTSSKPFKLGRVTGMALWELKKWKQTPCHCSPGAQSLSSQNKAPILDGQMSF